MNRLVGIDICCHSGCNRESLHFPGIKSCRNLYGTGILLFLFLSRIPVSAQLPLVFSYQGNPEYHKQWQKYLFGLLKLLSVMAELADREVLVKKGFVKYPLELSDRK
jgi:hypothetical protein